MNAISFHLHPLLIIHQKRLFHTQTEPKEIDFLPILSNIENVCQYLKKHLLLILAKMCEYFRYM